MRVRRPLLALLALMPAAVAGCGGTSAPVHHRLSGPVQLQHEFAPAGCSTQTAGGPALTASRPGFVRVNGAPFGVAVTADGRFAFVGGVGRGVGVFSLDAGNPHFLHDIPISTGAVGLSLTRNGRYLLVADGDFGAQVVDVARAEAGQPDAVLGDLSSAARNAGAGAIEVASSRDGRYVFVSIEYGGHIAVYDLQEALKHGFRSSGFVGSVPAGRGPVGLAVSPNGRWLYSTSELGASGDQADGVLEVIDIARAERDPAHSVVATVNAHCSPVRVAVSPNGATVWVTARESDQLLAFSAAGLRTHPAHALEAAVRVGESPVGLALADGGRLILVADSNRFNAPHAHAALSVVSAPSALAHRRAVLGSIRSGLFPREMALDAPAGTLIVGNFLSDSLEVVRLHGL